MKDKNIRAGFLNKTDFVDTPLLIAKCPLKWLEQASRRVKEGILDTHTIAFLLLDQPNKDISPNDIGADNTILKLSINTK